MSKKIFYDDYEKIVKDIHDLAEDDPFAGYGDPRAKLLLHIINEIELSGHDEKTFEDNDASECFVHDEISYASEDLESKIETLEERIKKLEAKL
jgi:hypothetical protein